MKRRQRAAAASGAPRLAEKSRRAIELHQRGELDDAEALYRQILAVMPEHFDALHLLGVVKGQQNEFAAAVPYFERALRVNPESAAVFNNYGNVLQALGRFSQALASYDHSLALRPDNPKGLMHRGNVLRKLSRPLDALASYDRALELRPDYAEALIHRADALADLGRHPEAVLAYRLALARGGDAGRIEYSLAALGAATVPKASPVEYVTGLFDQYAEAFDEHLVETLEYRTPALLVGAVRERIAGAALDVLDLGCGTGLCGPLLRPMARRLVGVDLSPKMLEKARRRAVYDELACDELVAYLGTAARAFDVAIAADVFVYIGDLQAVFGGVAATLRPGGVFAFSVEATGAGDAADYRLQSTHRFAHSLDYLRRLAAQAGFGVESVVSGVIRKNGDADILGHLLVLQRAAAPAGD
jgi:predicted TPR repeat methyltransferase